MTEREKELELEELVEIVKTGRELKKSHKGIAVRIQLNGYTKKHFPVEKLKRWVRKKVIRYSRNGFCGCPFCNRLIEVSDEGEKRVCEHLCDWNKITESKWFFKFALFDSLYVSNKIKELEDGT